MGLADARKRNDEVLRITCRGEDPAEIENLNTNPTLSELFEEWHSKGVDKRGNPWSEGHRRNVRYMFKADIIPRLGGRKVRDIRKADVRRVLEKIEGRAPNQALQVYRRLSRLFNYAASKDIIEASPMANLDPIGRQSKKSRYLSNAEIETFLAGLPSANMAPQTARILELILRTGQRPSEICGAHESEIDGSWWTIPDKRTKNGIANRVYLTGRARALFGVPNEHGLFFPSLRAPERPVSHTILSKALRRTLTGKEKKSDSDITLPLEPFSPHDLRRTCATHLGELGFTDEVIGALLNHKKRTVTGQHYNMFQYDPQKRQALEAWERKLERITDEAEQSGNVIQFPGSR